MTTEQREILHKIYIHDDVRKHVEKRAEDFVDVDPKHAYIAGWLDSYLVQETLLNEILPFVTSFLTEKHASKLAKARKALQKKLDELW